MSTSLATREVAGHAIDHDAVLRHLRLNPSDPRTQALLVVCDRYGLDPILKHVVLVDGNVYVTRDGLLHVAHSSGQLDGIEVVDEPHVVDEHWHAKVSVYRKDMGRPFTYVGRYPTRGGNQRYAPEMAVKCAEVMAMRRAFDVAIAAREELHDADEQPQYAVSVPTPEQLESERVERQQLLEALRDTVLGATSTEQLAQLWRENGPSATNLLDAIVADDGTTTCTLGELIIAKRSDLLETPAEHDAAVAAVAEQLGGEVVDAQLVDAPAAAEQPAKRTRKSDAQ